MVLLTPRRREGIERATIGPILTTVTGIVLLIVLIPALLLALWDVVVMQILLGREASGRRMVFHQYWLWAGHNGSRMLYGEPDTWAYTPPRSR